MKRVKEQLRSVPDSGIGFGLLRYLNPQTMPALARAGVPQICVNYLGRLNGSDETDVAAALPQETATRAMAHAVALDTLVRDTPQGLRLVANWTWPGDLLAERDMAELADLWFEALAGIVDHTRRTAGGRTPSDFPLVDLDQKQVDWIEQTWRAPADVLPLAPLQEGMLFHALLEGRADADDPRGGEPMGTIPMSCRPSSPCPAAV
ncbi:hypothetical protein GTV15_01800 [Streptomyces sp. SID7803]|nr:hypothetical protein [Streptomyces sp. SID7803]